MKKQTPILFIAAVCLVVVVLTGSLLFRHHGSKKERTGTHITVVQPSARWSSEMIDRSTISFISKVKPGSTIIVKSEGGRVYPSIELAQIIHAKRLHVVLDDFCYSACAELIIPAAIDIKAVNEPLIGVHGNPVIYQKILRDIGFNEDARCDEDMVQGFRDIYRIKGINANEVAQAEIDRLKFMGIWKTNRGDEHGCRVFTSPNYISVWFPSRKQLKTIFKTEISGAICADSMACIKRKIAKNWKPGSIYVVGDKVFVYGCGPGVSECAVDYKNFKANTT